MRPLLPRLVLCAILLLNGIGSAMASTHVALAASAAGAPATSEASAPATGTAAADCPHAGMRAPATTPSTAAHGDHGPGDAPMAADAECLKLCLDICLQQCQAVLASGIAGPAVAPRTVLSPAGAVMPVADAAYPPLRPPIA